MPSSEFFIHAAATNLPDFLFRAFHNGSFNRFDEGRGISSGDPSIDITNWHEAQTALSNHLNVFNTTSPTPFISVYADRKKVKGLAEMWRDRGKDGITIVTIHVREWKREWWRVLDITQALDYCQIPLRTPAGRDATESEYLVYGEIPPEVIRTSTVEEFNLL